jgi:hypothetical protein
MVIPESVLADAINSPDFEIYRRQVANDKHNDLSHFASSFNIKDLSKAFLGAENPVDATVKFRLLMAEWFRRKHPEQSQKYVNTPLDDLGLNSPRNELIPKRLFRILGQVCALHGASFEDILKQLPHKEVGMANDDCHPRFVACMLRLGDLLDMDDNRFCPIMQRVAGDNRPATSKAHEDKHNSIQHFRLDADRIEVSAVCESVDGYLEQWRWLDYLQDEVKNQMCKWQDIAPSPALGLLPTLGNIRVDIKGKNLILGEGKRPEFTLNSQRIMDLLKGENLYKKEDAIREVLQNAVDSTLIHMWLARPSESSQCYTTPEDQPFKEQLKKYPICVRLEKNDAFISEDGSSEWILTISDNGIGISWNDLPYLLNIGSSFSNAKRNEIIQSMPEWMRPSGTFGIGLQSVFMLTDEVQIRTKNFLSNEFIHITLHSPTGAKRGLVTVENLENSYKQRIGTELELKFKCDQPPNELNLDYLDKMTRDGWSKRDQLLDPIFPEIAYRILASALYFKEFSLHEIEVISEILKNSADDIQDNFKDIDSNEEKKFLIDSLAYFEVSFGMNNQIFPQISYRGHPVEKASISKEQLFFRWKIDLYSRTASEWLNFNRNSLSSNGQNIIDEEFDSYISEWLIKSDENIKPDDQKYLSALAKHKMNTCTKNAKTFWEKLSMKYSSQWKNLSPFFLPGEYKHSSIRTYNDLVNCDEICIHLGEVFFSKSFSTEKKDILLLSHNNPAQHILNGWFAQEWIEKPNRSILFFKYPTLAKNNEYYLIAKMQSDVTDNRKIEIGTAELAFAIDNATKDIFCNSRLCLPIQILSNPNFKDLEINNLNNFPGVICLFDPIFSPNNIPHLLLPHEIFQSSRKQTISLSRKEEFIEWLKPNLKKNLDVKEIRDLVDDLIKEISDLMKDYKNWRIYE